MTEGKSFQTEAYTYTKEQSTSDDKYMSKQLFVGFFIYKIYLKFKTKEQCIAGFVTGVKLKDMTITAKKGGRRKWRQTPAFFADSGSGVILFEVKCDKMYIVDLSATVV